MDTFTFNISAGSYPENNNIIESGNKLYINEDTQIFFDVKDANTNLYNIPLFIPDEEYVSLSGWFPTSLNTNFYYVSSGLYSATNYLYNGYYESRNRAGYPEDGLRIELINGRWNILYRNSNNNNEPIFYYSEATESGVEVQDVSWIQLSGGVAAPGNLVMRTRQGNTLIKVLADYGDGTTESVDLSFKNENFNTDDDRYSANSNWGIPAFYVPKDNWSHTYKSFSNSISGLGSFKFYYDNGKYLDYRFNIFKSNINLVDKSIKGLESQSFFSKEKGTLINTVDKLGNIINVVQTDNVDKGDSTGADAYYSNIRKYRDDNYSTSGLSAVFVAIYDGTVSESITLPEEIKFTPDFTTTMTGYIGLSSNAEFASTSIFNGLHKNLNENVNFNEFSNYINN